jgi:hypothetical protein
MWPFSALGPFREIWQIRCYRIHVGEAGGEESIVEWSLRREKIAKNMLDDTCQFHLRHF